MLCRDGVYYFVRRIPVDMQHHYYKCRLYFSLRTQSKIRAVRAAQSITQRLDDYWMGVRLQKLDIPKLSVIPDWTDRVDNAPLLSEAVEFYLKLKGHGRSKTFQRGAHRAKEYVIKVLGDRPISAYSSSDAGKFRDWLLDKGLTVVSTKRVFATIKSIINLNDIMSDAFEQQYGVKAKIKLEEKKYVRLRDKDEGDDMTMESILAHFDEYGDIYGRG